MHLALDPITTAAKQKTYGSAPKCTARKIYKLLVSGNQQIKAHNLRVKPLTFFGMIAAINHLHIQIARNQPDIHESFLLFFDDSKPSRFVYKKLG